MYIIISCTIYVNMTCTFNSLDYSSHEYCRPPRLIPILSIMSMLHLISPVCVCLGGCKGSKKFNSIHFDIYMRGVYLCIYRNAI